MRIKPTRRLPASLALLIVVTVLNGCSGSTEDVRETFCKNLAIAQLGVARDVEWDDTRQTIQRPEYALLTVRVKGGGRTSCWFEYDAVEESAQTHVDPLSAYATLPYQISVNGRVLGPREALDAVNAEQRRMGRAAIEQLRQAAQR